MPNLLLDLSGLAFPLSAPLAWHRLMFVLYGPTLPTHNTRRACFRLYTPLYPYTIELNYSKKELCFHIHRIPQLPTNFTNIVTPFWLAPGLISWSRDHGQAWVIECSNFEQAAHTERVSGILSTATHSINNWNRSVNLKKDIEATVYTLNFQSN